jgi:hypothetical protein
LTATILLDVSSNNARTLKLKSALSNYRYKRETIILNDSISLSLRDLIS